MSNRIDLAQFEGYIEKLGLREGHRLQIVEEPNRAIGPWNKWEGGLIFDLGETSAFGSGCMPTARLMVAAPRLLDELKRCYELIDAMQGNVPYVESCEECGATDGGEAEGCDYCGIKHYRSKPRGFLHRDSPKW